MNRRPSGFYFLTPVWGVSYTKLYIDTVIPAQLARGNLGAFDGKSGHRYLIFTTPQDADQIRSSRIYKELNACVPVTFEFFTDKVNVVHDMMTDCYRRGIAAAEDADAAVIFLTPDIVFSDGSFATIKRLAESGRDVIYIPAIRTMKKAVAASLEKSFRDANTIQVPVRQLMRIALDNLHPLANASWWDDGEGGLVPANLYWRIDDEGILGRCFHLHPVCVFPQRKAAKFFSTVDDDYVPAACPDATYDYIVEDSDELLAIELSDPVRFFVTRFAKGSVGDAVRWAEQFANARHRSLFKATIRMHTEGLQSPSWSTAEEKARLVARDIESSLARPAWSCLFHPDLLVGRLIQHAKGARVKFSNRSGAGPRTHENEAAKSQVPSFSPAQLLGVARARIFGLMRYVALFIEALLSRQYQMNVRNDLADMLPKKPDPVLVANNPEKIYLAPILSQLIPGFTADRYASLLRKEAAIILENGEEVPGSSKDLVILEADSYRTKDIDPYLHECRRILRDNGHLIINLHRMGFSGFSADPPISCQDLVKRLSSQFRVISVKKQGALGSFIRFRATAWLRGIVNRSVASRWLLLIFGVPMLPIIAVTSGIFVVVTALFEWFDRSDKYRVSNLVLTEKA